MRFKLDKKIGYLKGLYTLDIFAHTIAIKIKIFWYLIVLRNGFLLTNQGKLLKTLTYLGLSFAKSLPCLVIETNGSKISISFYRNIVWINI